MFGRTKKSKKPKYFNRMLNQLIGTIKENTQGFLSHYFTKPLQIILFFENRHRFTPVNENIRKIDFGVLGNFYSIAPDNKQEQIYDQIGPILNALDKEEGSRYPTVSRLTNEHHLLSSVNEQAAAARTLLKPYLTDAEHFLAGARKIIKTNLSKLPAGSEIHLQEFIYMSVYQTLGERFGLTDLPPEDYKIIRSMSEQIFRPQALFMPSLTFFNRDFAQTKNSYAAFSQRLLHAQVDKILSIFKNYEIGKNIIADAIAKHMLQKHPELSSQKEINAYLSAVKRADIEYCLEDKFIKTLPSLLITADNIATILTQFFTSMALMGSRYKILMEYTRVENTGKTLETILDSAATLNAQYSQLLKYQATSKIYRYTKNGVRLGDEKTNSEVTILPNSLIEFDLNGFGIKDNKNYLFSAPNHLRRCPGSRAAFYLFFSVIIALTEQPVYMDNQKIRTNPATQEKISKRTTFTVDA